MSNNHKLKDRGVEWVDAGAEIIALGDELTCGHRLDTNSQWLATELSDLGVSVHQHSTVGDDFDAIVFRLRTAVERQSIVITTGGLGPTEDDLTLLMIEREAPA